MNKVRAALAAAVVLGASMLRAAPAQAETQPSCVSIVREIPRTTVGPLISGLAQQFQPLGPVIASEATSPHDACPPE